MQNNMFNRLELNYTPLDLPTSSHTPYENREYYQLRGGASKLTGRSFDSNMEFNVSNFQMFETARDTTMYSLQSQLSSRNKSGFYNSNKFSTSLFSSDSKLIEIVKIIKNEDIDTLIKILPENINRIDSSGLSPLKIAIILSNISAVSLILYHQAFDEIKFQDLLNFTCEISTNDIIDELLKSKKFNVNYKDECGNTPLLIAVSNNKINTFTRLLEEPNIDVNCKDSLGNTPLIKCFYDKKTQMLYHLLGRDDTDINVKDKLGEDILKIAIKLSYNEMILQILDNHKFDLLSLKDLNNYFIDCITHYSIDKAVTDKLSLLVDINYQDSYNNTALHYTIFNSNVDKMESILRNPNVDLNLINISGMNCLMVACAKSSYDCLLRLLNKIKTLDNDKFLGILNQTNKNGENALFIALKNSHEALVILLLEYDIDVNIQDVKGYTPLIWTIVNKNYSLTKLLLNHPKIDINQTDFDDMTPLMHCLNGNITNFNRISGVSCNTFDMKIDTVVNLIFQIMKNPNLDINKKNQNGRTAFMECLLKAYNNEYNYKSVNASDPFCTPLMGNFPDCYGYSMTGSRDGYSDILSGNDSDSYFNVTIGNFLEREDVNLNIYDNEGKNILIYLIENGNMELFNEFYKYLESGRLDINSTNNEGQNCLIQIFFKLAGKPDSSDSGSKQVLEAVPLTNSTFIPGSSSFCTYKAEPNKVQSLSNMGTTIDSLSSSYSCYNPTTKVSPNKYLYFLRKLLELDCLDLDKQDIWGNSFIHYVCKSTNLATLRIIVDEYTSKKFQIDLNKQDSHGFTPVMLCYSKKFWDGVKLLGNLDMVDLLVKNKDGQTLFDLGKNQPSVLKNLLKEERYICNEKVEVEVEIEVEIGEKEKEKDEEFVQSSFNFNQSYDPSKVKFIEKKGWFS